MGRRGPPPTPTKLHVLRGTARPSRINKAEPQPVDRAPMAPADLDERSAAVWSRVLADFGHTGVIRGLDEDALRCYCEAVARYEQAARLLRDSGPLVRGKDGQLVKNPLHQVVRDNANLVRIYARELGLTPAARVGLHTEGKKAAPGKLARYLTATG